MYKDKRFSFFIMIEETVPVPSTLKCIEVFGENDGPLINQKLLQTEFISENFPQVLVRSTINLLCISNRKYFKIKNKLQQKHPIVIQPPSRKLLTDDEEIYIIQKVHEYQLQNDCLTSKDIRDIAQ